jgi:hypothetical protein
MKRRFPKSSKERNRGEDGLIVRRTASYGDFEVGRESLDVTRKQELGGGRRWSRKGAIWQRFGDTKQ